LKKIVFAVIASCMLLMLASCENQSSEEKNEKIKIVASAFPHYDLVKQIVGDKADIVMLLPAGGEVHTFDPSVKDIMNVAHCDVFVYNGGVSDLWVENVISSSENEHMIKFSFMENCMLIKEGIVEGMQHEHSEQKEHGHEEALYDEHVWTSPVKLSQIAQAFTKELCSADPDNSAFYSQNGQEYIEKLLELDARFKEVRKNAVRSTIVFGDRFPFAYFAEEYDLDYYAAFPGCASNTEASAATLAFITDKVKEQNIPVVFTIEFSDEKIADAVCSASGAKKLTLHSCHNVTKEQLDKGVTYLSLMEKNLEFLEEAICS